jgi:dTMP kinase
MPLPPLLITFEGVDGSGKSTQIRRLGERLRREGADPLMVREPGGTPLSERVRALLLEPGLDIAPRAELLLFSAARAHLVETAIRPALVAGRPVLCDRFYDSSTAYQGAGRGLAEPDFLAALHRFATGGLVPHRTFVLDVPPAVAAQRRGREEDRMEAAGADFFARVRDAYLCLAEAEPARLRVLDGTRSPDDLARDIWEDLTAFQVGSGAGTPPDPSG